MRAPVNHLFGSSEAARSRRIQVRSLSALKLRGREHQAMTPVWLSTPAPEDPAGIVYVAKRAHESADQAVWRYLQQNPKDRCASLAYVFEAGDGD